MVSQPRSCYEGLFSMIKIAAAVSREGNQLGAHCAVMRIEFQDPSVVVAAEREICAPFKIPVCIQRGMRHQDTERSLFRVPEYSFDRSGF